MDDELIISFGAPNTSVSYQGTGWSYPEDNLTWTLGRESTIILPRPVRAGDYRLQMRLRPFKQGALGFQRLGIKVNGTTVGGYVLRDAGTVECWLPWSLIGGPATTVVILHHPDIVRPCDIDRASADDRELAFAFEALRLSYLAEASDTPAALPPTRPPGAESAIRTALLDIDSLGYNCEVGMVQRHFGAEPLGLLRFCYSPARSVIAALEAGFARLGAPDCTDIVLDPETREYVIRDRLYGFEWHSWVHEGQGDPTALARQWTNRLPFLARKLLETIQSGDKLLVVTGQEAGEEAGLDEAEIDRLEAALRRHGGATLLWVALADAAHPAGTVEILRPGLLRAHISRLTPRVLAINAAMDDWAVIATRAHRLWRTAAPEARTAA